jgi:hypothetical protein
MLLRHLSLNAEILVRKRANRSTARNILLFGANQFVNNIFAKLLASARVLDKNGPTQYIFFKRDKVLFSRFDKRAHAILPRGVTVFY